MVLEDDKVRVVHVVEALAQQIPEGVEVKSLVSATNAMDVRPSDLIQDTDTFDSYAAKADFFRRQTNLNNLLHSSEVRVVWVANDSSEHVTTIHPQMRTLSSLSEMFWFTLVVIATAFIISSLVYLLRPQDWGARMFALSGSSFFIAGIAVALLSERAVALDGSWIQLLEASNTLMAYVFGAALISLLLIYPRPLLAPKYFVWVFAPYLVWWILDQAQWLPSPEWGALPAVLSIVVVMFLCGVLQWRNTQAQPLERAALRWFLLSILLSGVLFALTNVIPRLLGMDDLLPVGYATGFFLITYVGIALGLRRYRLFDIDEWSYRVLLWVFGAISVIALDALLIYFGLTEATSLGVSLLLAGWVYFPLRQWLWQRIVKKHYPEFESLLPELSAIAFTASHSEQKFRWESFLMRVFDPLEMKQGEADIKEAGVKEEGLALQVPACATLPSYTLRYAGRGIRLFSTRDANFAMALSELLHQVMGGRSSYEQGVAQERLRIGRDLHDNIGARLLKLIHHLRGTPDAELARDAMKDLRTSIAAMDSQPVPLRNALADWRAEANSRCEVAKCLLSWNQTQDVPEVDLPPRMKSMLESVMREVITNALKHASPKSIQVAVEANETKMKVEVENDGEIADPLTWQDGYGLRNIRGRMEELGGNLNISSNNDKVRLTLTVPLQ